MLAVTMAIAMVVVVVTLLAVCATMAGGGTLHPAGQIPEMRDAMDIYTPRVVLALSTSKRTVNTCTMQARV